MSDYLKNLAARALQRHEAVRPRLASLYEPSSGANPPLLSDPDNPETISSEPAADALSTRRSTEEAPSTIRPPTAPPSAMPPMPTAAAPRTSAEDSEKARSEFRPAVPAAPRERESTERDQPQFTSAEDQDETHRKAQETVRRVEVVRHETRVTGAADMRRGATEASAGERMRGIEGRVASPEGTRAVEGGRRGAFSPAPGAFATTLLPPSPSPFTPAAAPQPDPTTDFARRDVSPRITVTIGRVDVRAVFPAPPEAARAPVQRPGPATTLAEYLKRRERGGR